ncbi:transposase IS200-like domain-containing protein [Desulfonema limicola]|uniref:Transposase IS200-like domain-containing protein n=1 Tax=Desulfonema limicola TaxID=45656 RepID=A0A975B8F9_9BACT|nr:transposase [Desulfonema limicola]QTA80914.1 transposase IS200-like domain-containing protein [Desulfonema limicola]
MGRSRYRFIKNNQPHFLTCTIVNWLPLFGKPAIAGIVIDSLKFMYDNQRLKLYAYVIMENHLHMIASSDNLGKEIANFKSYSARKIIDFLTETKAMPVLRELSRHKLRHKTDRKYQFWQEGSHPQLIQNEEIMIQKIEYIHNNPLARGYVDDPIHWKYSSARNYMGHEAILTVERFI